MERELILTVHDNVTPEYIEAEKRYMEKIFPYVESFYAFRSTHEILNTQKNKRIKKTIQQFKVFLQMHPEPFVFVINKN
jgi:hypothetical protein